MTTNLRNSTVFPAHIKLMTFAFDSFVGENSQKLEKGKIKLMTGDSNLLFQATSGLPGFQTLNSSSQKGRGRIPTCLQAKITNYFVKTQPVYLPHVKGVNGNFYPIIPFAVSVGKYQRSDLGIHRDTNVPGSAGCLVITLDDHWKLYEIEMLKLANQGITQISLLVS